MAVAGQRSTGSASTEISFAGIYGSSIESTEKSSGTPGWISIENISYRRTYTWSQDLRDQGPSRYEAECDVVFNPGSGVSAGTYNYSFQINLRLQDGSVKENAGSFSGSETVTRPASPPPPRRRYVPLSLGFESRPGLVEPGDSDTFSVYVVSNVGEAVAIFVNTSLSYSKTGARKVSDDGSRVEHIYSFRFTVPRSASTGYIPINVEAISVNNAVDVDHDVRIYAGRWPSVPSFVIRGPAGSAVRHVRNITSAGFSVSGSPNGFSISGITLSRSGNEIIVSGTMPSSYQLDSYSLAFERRHARIGLITASPTGSVVLDPVVGTIGEPLSWDDIDDIHIHVGEPESPTSIYLGVVGDYLSGPIARVSSRTSYTVTVRARNSSTNTSATTSFNVILMPIDTDDGPPPPRTPEPPRWQRLDIPFPAGGTWRNGAI